MNELFRKYGKHILAVVGVLLMIIWMLPNKSGGGGETGDSISRGELKGKKITNRDLVRAKNDLALLGQLSQILMQKVQAAYLSPQADRTVVAGQAALASNLEDFLKRRLDQHQSDVHLFLLLKEAQQYGLAATNDEVRELERQAGLTAKDKTDWFEGRNITRTDVLLALSDYAVVNKVDDQAYEALRPSLPELQHLADATRATVAVAYGVLDANQVAPGAPEPDSQAIAAQFDAYKGVVPEVAASDPPLINGHKYPFAYKYPDRVKIEYLEFDRQGLREKIKATPEDALAAWEYYKANPAEFTEEPTTQGAMGPATATAPAIKPFATVQKQLVDAQVNARVEQLLKQMTEWALTTAGKPWQKVDEKGYKLKDSPETPLVSYEQLANTIQQDKQYGGYRPTYRAAGEWLGQAGLQELPGLGAAVLPLPNGGMARFPELALHVREIDEVQKEGYQKQLQVGVEGPMVLGTRSGPSGLQADGKKYLYRVVAADKAHEPASLAEVKGQVIADLQKLAAYQRDQEEGKKLAAEAAHKGLKETPGVGKVQQTLAFSREKAGVRMSYGGLMVDPPKPTEIPGLGVVPQFADAAFQLAARASNGAGAEAPVNAPAATAPAIGVGVARTPVVAGEGTKGYTTGTVALDSKLKVYVLQLVEYQPVATDKFDQVGTRSDLDRIARRQAGELFAPKWNRIEAVAARVGYIPPAASPFREE